MNDVVVLRYGELFLKGGNRASFEGKLVTNVRRLCSPIPSARVHKLHARILVEVAPSDTPRLLSRLRYVFGIQSMSPARIVEANLDAIGAEAVRAAQAAITHHTDRRPTFKVETNRREKRFPKTSQEISRDVGAFIVQATGLDVDVHQPDVTIGVEIGPERSFVYAERVPGPGGLPVGATGLVNLLLSGGIDSPVAGYLAMKRGCSLTATYFHSFPYTGDRTKEKVLDLARLLAPYQGEIRVHVVPFTDLQKELRAAGTPDLAVVLYRRAMMRVASRLAHKHGALALCTGENLAQVASQTLENLGVIEEASSLPVLRPLLTNDKLETIALAKKIGTFETSIQPYEDCCSLFVPAHPATRAKLEHVRAAEAKLDMGAMVDALAERTETVVVN